MPLKYSSSNIDTKTQKILRFKDTFLALYCDAVIHPEKAINSLDQIIDDWNDASNDFTPSDAIAKSDLTNITINIASVSNASTTYIRIRDHFVTEAQRSSYDLVTKNCQRHTNVMTLTYPKEYYNPFLFDILHEDAFNLSVFSNNRPSKNQLNITKKILTKLTSVTFLAEILSATSKETLTSDDFDQNIMKDMPLVKQFKKDILYDNGIENHVPNLNEIFDTLVILLLYVAISNENN